MASVMAMPVTGATRSMRPAADWSIAIVNKPAFPLSPKAHRAALTAMCSPIGIASPPDASAAALKRKALGSTPKTTESHDQP